MGLTRHRKCQKPGILVAGCNTPLKSRDMTNMTVAKMAAVSAFGSAATTMCAYVDAQIKNCRVKSKISPAREAS